MALSYNGLEPVSFKGKACTPKIDAELKMRLASIKKYDESTDAILASAFPNDEAYVKDFISSKMTDLEKQILHAYLVGGDIMVNSVMEKVKSAFSGGDGDE